jgi:hypothetical protein
MWVLAGVLFACHFQTAEQLSRVETTNDELRNRIAQQESLLGEHAAHALRLETHVKSVRASLEDLSTVAPDPRQLLARMTVSSSSFSGCLEVADADTTYDLNSADCISSGVRCPQCFIANSLSADRTYTISSCSTMRVGSAAVSGTQMLEFLFINAAGGQTMTIRSGATDYSQYKLGPLQQVHATCFTGGSNQLNFVSNQGGNVYDAADGQTQRVCPTGCDTPQPINNQFTDFTYYMAPALVSTITCDATAHSAAAGTITVGSNDQVDSCNDYRPNRKCRSCSGSGTSGCKVDQALGADTTFSYNVPGIVTDICTSSR